MTRLPRLLVVSGLAAAAACSTSDSFQPTTDNVIGMYEIESFVIDSAGTARDLVAAGATLELILMPFGDVLGMLNVPGDTTADHASMNGTWTLSGHTVRFTQQWDTFVRNMDWVAGKDQLSADKTFGAVRIRVILKKQPNPTLP